MTLPVVQALQFDKLRTVSFRPNQYYEDFSSIYISDYGESKVCLSKDILSAHRILLSMDIFQNRYIGRIQDGQKYP